MKSIVKMMVIVLISTVTACGQKEKTLYDQVMDIHDEVMPKIDDLHKMKKTLQDSIAKTPGMGLENRVKIEGTILQLDSATNSMMIWMREFNPPEQTDKEAFNKYMESELVKVKKMRDQVTRALEAGKKRP